MIYGYTRTRKKELEKQIEKLKETKCDEIIYDCFETYGEKQGNLELLINKLKVRDEIIVEDLINLSRSIEACISIAERILAKEAYLKVLKLGTIGKEESILITLKAVARLKKNGILEDAKVGKEIASKNIEFKAGRPKKYSKRQIENAINLLSINGGGLSYSEVSQLTKISKSTLIRESKKLKDKL